MKRPPLHFEDDGIRRYLLFLLPEPDAEALEDAYLASPELLDRVRGVEHDLLDDYVADRLGAVERAHFEHRYLAAPRLQERVALARALRRATGAAPAATRLVHARPPYWQGLAAIAAALVLGVLASSRWRTSAPTLPPAPPARLARVEPAPAPAQSPAATRPVGARLAFALSPTLLRAGGGPVELRFPRGTATVALELEGDPAVVPRTSRLRVAVTTVEGGRVWTGNARRVFERARPSLLASVDVPGERLVPGDYLVTLSGDGAPDEPLHRYFLRVSAP